MKDPAITEDEYLDIVELLGLAAEDPGDPRSRGRRVVSAVRRLRDDRDHWQMRAKAEAAQQRATKEERDRAHRALVAVALKEVP